jgi:nicotinate-nucleotide pyrophosphorylase (carboxylating)
MHTIQQLIEIALNEDIGPGDITTDNLVDPEQKGSGEIIAKESLVIAGLDVARQVFEQLDSGVVCSPQFKDGDMVAAGETVMDVKGRLRALLTGERTALNFIQRLSGIATHVRSYVEALENKKVRLVDTRKTTPGWRMLEKYAVRVGGAFNHRMALYDAVLIKDNHIQVSGGIRNAVSLVRKQVSHLTKIEVEVSTPEEVKEALSADADVIMLDNMDPQQIKAAVKEIAGKAVVEVSGSVTKDKLSMLADTGVDIISSGALTHSAPSVDISMNIR